MNAQISLPSFDNRGQTYVEGGRIMRRINAEFADQTRVLLETYQRCDLAALGVVPTTIAAQKPDLVLNHQRYPIILKIFNAVKHVITKNEIPLFNLSLFKTRTLCKILNKSHN